MLFCSLLFTASSNGQICWTDLKTDTKTTTVITTLGKDLTCARLHPQLGHILAVGGKERELTLYDMNVLSGKSDSITGIETSSTNNTTKYKKQKENEKGQIFQAKNVRAFFFLLICLYNMSIKLFCLLGLFVI